MACMVLDQSPYNSDFKLSGLLQNHMTGNQFAKDSEKKAHYQLLATDI